MASSTWTETDWALSENPQRSGRGSPSDPPQHKPARRGGPRSISAPLTVVEGRSLGGGLPDVQHAAVRHAEHLECRPFEAVHILAVLVGDCEGSLGETLTSGVHLCGVTLEVVSDLGPGDVKCLEDDLQRLWAVDRGRYERARLHGASLPIERLAPYRGQVALSVM